MKDNRIFIAVALCFAFMCIGIASMLVNTEKHYTIQQKNYHLNGEKLLEQTFNPSRAKIVFSWKDNSLTKNGE